MLQRERHVRELGSKTLPPSVQERPQFQGHRRLFGTPINKLTLTLICKPCMCANLCRASAKLIMHKNLPQCNFAKWEPCHGKFKFRHPWSQYQKLGALSRQCASSMEALASYVITLTRTEVRTCCRSIHLLTNAYALHTHRNDTRGGCMLITCRLSFSLPCPFFTVP